MKIKIITCNRAYNLGAILQTYALQEYISSLNHDVKVIDYNPRYFSGDVKYTYLGSFKDKNILLKFLYCTYKIPQRFKDHRTYKGFLKKHIRKTKEYCSYEELEKSNLSADVFICGSDQIWCPTKPTGNDKAMYLGFIEGTKKISYAASFGEKELTDAQEDFLKTQIQDFSCISVRESSALDILEKIGIESTQVVDPVFLLSKDKWSNFAKFPKKIDIKNNYLLVYPMATNDTTSILEAARKIATKKNLNIIVIGRNKKGLEETDRLIDNCTPQNFVSLIEHSTYVVTNSFHGTCFSIVFNKNFSIWGTEEIPNARIDSLLKLTHLSGRYMKTTNSDNTYVNINYTVANKIIEDNIFISKHFLLRSIQD